MDFHDQRVVVRESDLDSIFIVESYGWLSWAWNFGLLLFYSLDEFFLLVLGCSGISFSSFARVFSDVRASNDDLQVSIYRWRHQILVILTLVGLDILL
jgi:hypothetical protein